MKRLLKAYGLCSIPSNIHKYFIRIEFFFPEIEGLGMGIILQLQNEPEIMPCHILVRCLEFTPGCI